MSVIRTTGFCRVQPSLIGFTPAFLLHLRAIFTGSVLDRLPGLIAVTPLMRGVLWAMPLMLRLALIENLRRVSVRMTDKIHLNQTQDWAHQMMEVAERDTKNLILVIADMIRSIALSPASEYEYEDEESGTS